MPVELTRTPDEFFEAFVNAQTFKTILHSFDDLCRSLRLDRTQIGYGRRSLYKHLTTKLPSWKSKSLWSKIDKRGAQKEYENGNACSDLKVCIVGAGPVGLRLAIECALLGARCVVVEKRDRFSRHNVLHLWPYVITDLKNLGAKVFYGKFATGQIEHISIRQLQCILLKIALVLGVEIYQNVKFIDAIEPTSAQQGWRAQFEPENHPIVSNYEFQVLIGADGRRNSLQGFQHKEFRGKLAIGVTCNFVNHNTREEQNFQEISGVAKIYNPQFFNELQQQTSIDLENIVYYKNDTHYFVMTAKKQSLLDKNVIRQDFPDAARLLARDNVNFTQLCNFACEAAQFATKCSSQFTFEFAENHYGAPDVQMFDFTSLFHAVNASRIVERHGKQILMALVGDSLLESFWPTGSGAGLGFFGLFDTAWAILKFAKREHPLKVLVERESIYMLLSQSTPENTKSNHQLYSINPATRYQTLNSKSCTVDEIRYLYDSDQIPTIDVNNNVLPTTKTPKGVVRRVQSFKPAPVPLPLPSSSSSGTTADNHEQELLLIDWCEEIVDDYEIDIKKDSKAFQNALAFCAIVNYYRPDLIDFKSLLPERPISNFQILFDVMHDQLSLPVDRKLQNSLILSMKSSAEDRIRQAAIVILQLLYTQFHHDHHEQQHQRRRASTTSLDVLIPSPTKSPVETNPTMEKPVVNNTNNNSTVKVSALVAHYSNSEAPTSTSTTTTTNNSSPMSTLPSQRAPTFCFYCKEKVSIQDWFVVEKNVLHVKCFKCDTCHLQLRKTNYQVFTEPTTGKMSFHCRYHNLNKQQTKDENETMNKRSPLGLDHYRSPTDVAKVLSNSPSISRLEKTIADERVSFTLKKDPDDNKEKEEVVYSSLIHELNDGETRINNNNNEVNDDDDESTHSSLQETTDEDDDEQEEDDDDEPSEGEQQSVNEDIEEGEEEEEDEDSMIKGEKSNCDSSGAPYDRQKSFAERKPYLSIDSGHIQSESPSPIDLSPSPTSNFPTQVLTSNKTEPSSTYSYFRAPCPICGGSTYDEESVIDVEKTYFHKKCLKCTTCEKPLKENEYGHHELSTNGQRQFFCILHFCKNRLKQVTNTLATATKQESQSSSALYPSLGQLRSKTSTAWTSNYRLYPSLSGALSSKTRPLNLGPHADDEDKHSKLGFEHINQSIAERASRTSPSELVRNRMTDEIDSSKQRFKRRTRNRPSSPLPAEVDCQILQHPALIPPNNANSLNRKKKRILVQQNLLHASSSSTASSSSRSSMRASSMHSLNDEQQRFLDERRRQKEERQKESERLRRSQEIQRELDVLETKRIDLDQRQHSARQNLNAATHDEKKRAFWERECLCLVRERTKLQRSEDELSMAKRGLMLENERASAENEYRQLINLPDDRKSAKDRDREEKLIQRIAKLVEERNRLTTELDRMRLREIAEDERVRQVYRLHGIDENTTNFSAPDILKDII